MRAKIADDPTVVFMDYTDALTHIRELSKNKSSDDWRDCDLLYKMLKQVTAKHAIQLGTRGKNPNALSTCYVLNYPKLCLLTPLCWNSRESFSVKVFEVGAHPIKCINVDWNNHLFCSTLKPEHTLIFMKEFVTTPNAIVYNRFNTFDRIELFKRCAKGTPLATRQYFAGLILLLKRLQFEKLNDYVVCSSVTRLVFYHKSSGTDVMVYPRRWTGLLNPNAKKYAVRLNKVSGSTRQRLSKSPFNDLLSGKRDVRLSDFSNMLEDLSRWLK